MMSFEEEEKNQADKHDVCVAWCGIPMTEVLYRFQGKTLTWNVPHD